MPDLGDKVGDVYVEVHAELDRAGLIKANKELAAKATKAQKDLNEKLVRNHKEAIEKAHINAINSEKSRAQAIGKIHAQALDEDKKRSQIAQKRIDDLGKAQLAAFREEAHRNELRQKQIDDLGRIQVRAINEDLARTKAANAEKDRIDAEAQRKKFSRARSFQEEIDRAHAQALKENLDRQQKFDKDVIKRLGKRRFKDGGAPNFAQGFEAVISILPGQLEKLFRSPTMTGIAIGAGAAFGSAMLLGIGGTLAAGTGLTAIVGLAATLISKDQQVKDAFASIGQRSMSALLDQALQFKPAFIEVFNSIGSSVSGFLRGLDLSKLIPQVRELGKGFGKFLENAGPGFQALINTAVPLLSDFSQTALPNIGKAFTSLGKTIENNKDSIRFAMAIIGNSLAGVIYGLGLGIRLASGTVRTLTDIIGGATKALYVLIEGFNAVTGRIPGFGEKFHINTEGLQKFSENAFTLGESVLPTVDTELGNTSGSLVGLAGDTKTALGPAGDLTTEMQDQAAAYQLAFDKQSAYDQALRSGLGTQQTWTTIRDEMTNTLKENGKTLDQNKVKGVANAKFIEGAFKDLKATYADDVRENRISREKAQEEFRKRAASILSNFDKSSPAYKVLQGMIDKLDDFPPVVKTQIEIGIEAAQANINNLKSQLAGLGTAAERAKAKAQVEKNRAGGGAVFGPGTATSDSIPANLSNGEFVIKASSAKKIGYGNLGRMNATGKAPMGFASGGKVGRGSTPKEKAAFEALLREISLLTKTITSQSKALEKYNNQLAASSQQFSSFVNLSALDTEGKSTGDLLQQLQGRKAAAGGFASRLKSLKARGLSSAALQQVSEAGPDSPLAKMLMSATSYDIGLINRLLGGGAGYAAGIAETIQPGGKALSGKLAQNQKKLVAKKKQAAKLKPVRARGATISYAGGKTSALFSSKELQQQQLKTGTYVTVVIDGKEVRAIVKEEQRKVTSKSNRQMKSGRK